MKYGLLGLLVLGLSCGEVQTLVITANDGKDGESITGPAGKDGADGKDADNSELLELLEELKAVLADLQDQIDNLPGGLTEQDVLDLIEDSLPNLELVGNNTIKLGNYCINLVVTSVGPAGTPTVKSVNFVAVACQ